MRRLAFLLLIFCVTPGFAAPTLSRRLARNLISELASFKLVPDAIEIRGIKPESPDRATVESTITLAFQFKKTTAGQWSVDAIRLGDRDWADMNELLAAIYHGNPPQPPPPAPLPPKEITPIDRFHVNKSDFEKERAAMIELGLSPLVPDAIEIRRIIAANDVRTIAEATVTMGFQFTHDAKANTWKINAARLGDRPWINVTDLLATLNDGRRRQTVTAMEKLAAAIEKYRADKGALPQARDIVVLTDILHPLYISELIREDGWGHELQYTVSGNTYRLRSRGLDGRFNTSDDVVVTNGSPASP